MIKNKQTKPKISTYDRNDFYNNWEDINKSLAQKWDEVVRHNPHKDLKNILLTDKYYVDSRTKLLDRWLPKDKGLKLLKFDLYNEATGTEGFGEWFIGKGYDYYGVDISKEVVRLAKKKFKEKTDVRNFKVGDIRDLPFKDNFFDILISLGTIEHIRENAQAVEEAFRVLKPGGIFISGVNNKFDLWLSYIVNELANKTFKYLTSYEPSYYPWEQKEWFKEAGFENIKITGMLMFPHILRYIDLFLEWKEIRGPLRYFWDSIIIKPFIHLANFLDSSEKARMLATLTTAIGYKPKIKK